MKKRSTKPQNNNRWKLINPNRINIHPFSSLTSSLAIKNNKRNEPGLLQQTNWAVALSEQQIKIRKSGLSITLAILERPVRTKLTICLSQEGWANRQEAVANYKISGRTVLSFLIFKLKSIECVAIGDLGKLRHVKRRYASTDLQDERSPLSRLSKAKFKCLDLQWVLALQAIGQSNKRIGGDRKKARKRIKPPIINPLII